MASRAFILITLSAFLALGANQVIVKWFSKSEDLPGKLALLSYGTAINFGAALLAFSLVSLLVASDFWFYAGLIACGKLLLENFCTINRVHEKLLNVNIIYLSNTLPLAISFWFLQISSMYDYFELWASWIWFSVAVSVFVSRSTFKKYSHVPSKIARFIKEKGWDFIVDGLKLAAIGVLVPLVSSGDKLFISFMSLDSSTLGSMQLADNIAMALSFGVGAVIYAITPRYIDMVRNQKIALKDFFLKGYLMLFLVTILFLIMIQLVEPALVRFFPAYDLVYPLSFYVLARILISGMFMFNITVLVFSDEMQYIRFIFITLLLFASLLIGVFLVPTDSYSVFYFAPICGSLSLVFLHLASIVSVRMKIKDQI